MKKKIIAGVLAVTMLTANIPMITAFADAMPIVTVGADLSAEQREKVMDFFNVDESTVEVIEIDNTQERKYLEGLVPDEKIGHKTLSCSYIYPTTRGGIIVKTANLTWVNDGMIANALITAGIENCQVIATAPFPVSGTGALTGVLAAYEKSADVTLDEDKKALATEEIVLTGDIIDEVMASAAAQPTTDVTGETVQPATDEKGNTIEDEVKGITEARLLQMLNEIKTEVINGNLTEDEIKAIVDKHLKEYKIELTEYTYNKLVDYLKSLTAVSYSDKIKENISGVTDRIKDGFKIDVNINLDGITDTVQSTVQNVEKNWFEKIIDAVVNFFKALFGGGTSDEQSSSSSSASSSGSTTVTPDTTEETLPNIFEGVDTDIFDFDKSVAGDEEETTENSDDAGIIEEGPIEDIPIQFETEAEQESIIETTENIAENEHVEDNPSLDDLVPASANDAPVEDEQSSAVDVQPSEENEDTTSGDTGVSLDDIVG